MSSEEGRNIIALVPIAAVAVVVAIFLLARLGIGPTSEQERDLRATDFVPAESPYSTGEHSR